MVEGGGRFRCFLKTAQQPRLRLRMTKTRRDDRSGRALATNFPNPGFHARVGAGPRQGHFIPAPTVGLDRATQVNAAERPLTFGCCRCLGWVCDDITCSELSRAATRGSRSVRYLIYSTGTRMGFLLLTCRGWLWSTSYELSEY